MAQKLGNVKLQNFMGCNIFMIYLVLTKIHSLDSRRS